jgi:chromosome segregation ATPase
MKPSLYRELTNQLLAYTTNVVLEDDAISQANGVGPKKPINVGSDKTRAAVNSHHSHQVSPDEVAATHIERLLAAIERLRGERDDLRRHVHFLETEARFAAESARTSPEAVDVHHHPKAATGSVVTSSEAEVTVEKNRLLRRMDHALIVSAIVMGNLQHQADAAADDFSQHLANIQRRLDEKEEKLGEMEVQLEVTVQCLSDASSERKELQSQVSLLESRDEEREAEIFRLTNAYKEMHALLECAETTIAETTASLEEIQSERDSLILQVTNLQTDLNGAQEDLAEAEQRYSSLQCHQLASMSSNEVIRSLRDQIEELNNRVLRRTEQIGIHQHDIKRLETNMRLQEERIAEMTAELEMLSAQKEAMVEDCADAREARDEAIQRVEELEMEVEGLEGRTEMLEGRIRCIEAEREIEVSSLVGLVIESVGQCRDATTRAKNTENEAEKVRSAGLMQDEIAANNIRQITVAFALSQLGSKQLIRSLQSADEAGTLLRNQLTDLQAQLATSLPRLADARSLAELQADQIKDLQTRLQDLHSINEEMERNHHNVVQDLIRLKGQLDDRQAETQLLAETEIPLGDNDPQRQLDQLRDQYTEEVAELKLRLSSTTNDLEEARRLHSEAEAHYEETFNELARSKQQLTDSLQVASDRSEIEKEVINLRARHAEELELLQQQLHTAAAEAHEAKCTLGTLQSVHQQDLDKLARTEQEHKHRLEELTERSQALEYQLEIERTRNTSQASDLQAKLEASSEAVCRLERELREESERVALEKEAHEKDRNMAVEQSAKAESIRADLHEEINTLRVELEKSRSALESLQEEKECLRVNMTNLEAEIQRSISLGRYLESQVKDRCVRLSFMGSRGSLKFLLASGRSHRSRRRLNGLARTFPVPRSRARQQKLVFPCRCRNMNEQCPICNGNWLSFDQNPTWKKP